MKDSTNKNTITTNKSTITLEEKAGVLQNRIITVILTPVITLLMTIASYVSLSDIFKDGRVPGLTVNNFIERVQTQLFTSNSSLLFQAIMTVAVITSIIFTVDLAIGLNRKIKDDRKEDRTADSETTLTHKITLGIILTIIVVGMVIQIINN